MYTETLAVTPTHKRRRHGRYFIYYTLGFALLALLVFSAYIATGRTFIWEGDAWSQHYKALVYYSQYLRGAVRGLFSGNGFTAPMWDHSIGEGADVLTTLHYYVIGDPLTLLSVFVPTSYIHILYEALIVLRLYLAGAFFSCFCFFCGYKSERAVMIGAFTYCFSFWAIMNAGRHPYFLNPMIYFPLLLIGFELVFRRRRPYLLILIVAVSAASNFYFFYMLVAASVLYVICRLFVTVRRGEADIKFAVGSFLRVAGCSLLGVMIAAAVMLPVGMTFLRETRASIDYKVGIIYPLHYYIAIPGMLAGDTGGEYWLCAGFSVVTFPSVLLLFRRKGRPLLKLFYIIAGLIICFPVLGHALNGFTYVTNRWTWALAFLAAFTVTTMWREFARMGASDFIHICISEGVIFILCLIFVDSRTLGSMSAMALTFLLLALTAPRTDVFGARLMKRIWCERITAVIACVSIVTSALCYSSSIGRNNVAEHVPAEGIAEKLYDNETAHILEMAAESGAGGFYRYSGPRLTENAGTLLGMSSTQYYWSLSNPNVIERNTALAIRDYWLSEYGGCDGRTVMNALSSVRFYVTPSFEKPPVPYGFDKSRTFFDDSEEAEPGYKIYEKTDVLPFGYTYGSALDRVAWETLDPAAREEAMMYGVLLDEGEDAGVPIVDPTELIMGEERDYKVNCFSEGVSYEDGCFTVTDAYSSAVLRFDNVQGAEMFLYFEDFAFEGTSEYDLYLGGDNVDPKGKYGKEEWDALSFWDKWYIWQDDIFWVNPVGVGINMRSGTVSNTMLWYTSRYQFYNGRDDFLINLGSHYGGDSSLTITFPRPGIYSFGDMKLITRPFKAYNGTFDALAEDTLCDVVFGKDMVTGSISLDEPKLLCLTIPYSEGWQATVDGEPARLLRANMAYMALPLDAGEHTVVLEYETPFRTAGCIVSAIGASAFAAVVAITELRRKKARLSPR